MKKSLLSIILIVVLCFLTACSNPTVNDASSIDNSMIISNEEEISSEEIIEEKPTTVLISQKFSPKAEVKSVVLNSGASNTGSVFGYKLFKNAHRENENTLISPISIMYALAMAQNGASGQTLRQFENAFGVDRNTLNVYLKNYLDSATEELKLAQSMWLKPQGNIKDSFLQTNADYFKSDIFSTPMDDTSVAEINKWIEEKTDGEIKEAVDRISPNTQLMLVNATLFNGKWEEPYDDWYVRENDFNNFDGSVSKATFLRSVEYQFLSGDGFTGFYKVYDNERFYFTALLPDENSSLSELISSLDGSDFSEIINNVQNEKVIAEIPEFDIDYKVDLIPILKKMGIKDAFNFSTADFSDMGDIGLYLSQTQHNTSIKLDRYGTKAAASTHAASDSKGPYVPPKEVILNRPFLYAIYDSQAEMPVFIGTVCSLPQ